MHLENQLSELLIFLLNTYESIELRGIGVFQMKNIPAVYKKPDAIILPPTKELFLVNDNNGAVELLTAARSMYVIDRTQFVELTQEIQRLASELQLKGTIRMSLIGTISREAQSGISTLIHDENSPWLPQLPVSVQNTNTDAFDLAPSQMRQKSMKGMSVKETTKGTNLWNQLWPLLLMILGTILILFIFQYYNKESNQEPTTAGGSSSLIDAIIQDSITKQDLPPIFTNPNLQKYQGVLNQEIINIGCQISIEPNKESLSSIRTQLESEGYDVLYSKDKNVLTLTFSCLDQDLEERLSAIQNKYSETARLVRPEWPMQE